MPIFDQGYQHWEGTLSGHGWRWLAVARHGVRAQLKNRFVRLMLLVAWLPALALVTALTLWGLIEQRAESIISLVQRLLPPDLIAQLPAAETLDGPKEASTTTHGATQQQVDTGKAVG